MSCSVGDFPDVLVRLETLPNLPKKKKNLPEWVLGRPSEWVLSHRERERQVRERERVFGFGGFWVASAVMGCRSWG